MKYIFRCFICILVTVSSSGFNAVYARPLQYTHQKIRWDTLPPVITIENTYRINEDAPFLYTFRINPYRHHLSSVSLYKDGDSIPLTVLERDNSVSIISRTLSENDIIRLKIIIEWQPPFENMLWYEARLNSPRDIITLTMTGDVKYYLYPDTVYVERTINRDSDTVDVTIKGESNLNQPVMISNCLQPESYLQEISDFFYSEDTSALSDSALGIFFGDRPTVESVTRWIMENITLNDNERARFIPEKISEILENLEGNCLDRVYLAYYALTRAGVRCHPALIYDIKSGFLTPDIFQHMVLCVEKNGKHVLADMNGFHLPENLNLLVIKPGGILVEYNNIVPDE